MIKVNELFAGIGAFRKALVNLQIPHEVVGISEIDKYAILSYEAIYGKTKNYGDISKVDKLDYADLWTYGFPCQDISVAGKRLGIIKNETRSGLLYEVERLLLESQQSKELPKYLIMENVKNIVSKKFKADFERWLGFLKTLGYANYWRVLNAKDYNIPRNRERVFCISIRNDVQQSFVFPEREELQLRLRDYLEHNVDSKYHLSGEQVARMKRSKFNQSSFNSRVCDEEGVIRTLCARDFKDPCCVMIGTLYKKGFESSKRVYSDKGICPTLTTCGGGGIEVKVETDEVIRKLTPKEYWRLMGFNDEDFNKANKVCSNTQLYKQAGNSIVVPVLEKILQNLLLSRPWEIENKSCSKWLDDLLVIPHEDYANEINYL